MALKAVHVSDVPLLDQVPESPSSLLSTSRLSLKGPESVRASFKAPKFLVIGHRGKGMNALASADRRLKAVKENTVLSFNEAARFPVDFVEFDVQVGKSLHRKTKDGRLLSWKVETDDALCTLQEVFLKVDPKVGFNVELKFDDDLVYSEEELTWALQAILQVVFEFAKERPVIFSSFQPDAAQLMRKLQSTYPVFFLTNGGNEVYRDERRNSLEEAVKHCLANGLQGIVSEARGVFRNPTLIPKIKESNLGLLTYGQLNNVAEAVYMQHLMGVDGVIVDLVQEISEAVAGFTGPAVDGEDATSTEAAAAEEAKAKMASRPKFSQRELSFLFRLIPELVQH